MPNDARTLSPDAQGALEAMRRMRIGVLSVMLDDAQPYSAVVNVHVGDDFRLYVAMSRETRKFRALVKNAKVSFNMGFQEEPVDNFQIIGTAEVLKGAARWEDLLEALKQEDSPDLIHLGKAAMTSHYPFRHFPTEDAAIVAIVPNWIRWFRHRPDAETPEHVMVIGKDL